MQRETMHSSQSLTSQCPLLSTGAAANKSLSPIINPSWTCNLSFCGQLCYRTAALCPRVLRCVLPSQINAGGMK